MTYWIQLSERSCHCCLCCELVTCYYLWHIEYNHYPVDVGVVVVVNWLHTLSLTYWIQHRCWGLHLREGCELVTYYYLWHIEYNSDRWVIGWRGVVNWLHTTIFDILNTTRQPASASRDGLWIGYILLSLTYWIQQDPKSITIKGSCELVTYYYLWHIEYNLVIDWYSSLRVVNWLHTTIFDILNTTGARILLTLTLLWIGYILLSLTYWIQPRSDNM